MADLLGVGAAENAASGTLDERGFLTYTHGGTNGKVLDVAHWKYEVGNDVNFVGHVSARGETFKEGGGRSFVLNGDGTLACKHAPHLVLGLNPPDCTLVNS